jgi:hypothetical protein
MLLVLFINHDTSAVDIYAGLELKPGTVTKFINKSLFLLEIIETG